MFRVPVPYLCHFGGEELRFTVVSGGRFALCTTVQSALGSPILLPLKWHSPGRFGSVSYGT